MCPAGLPEWTTATAQSLLGNAQRAHQTGTPRDLPEGFRGVDQQRWRQEHAGGGVAGPDGKRAAGPTRQPTSLGGKPGWRQRSCRPTPRKRHRLPSCSKGQDRPVPARIRPPLLDPTRREPREQTDFAFHNTSNKHHPWTRKPSSYTCRRRTATVCHAHEDRSCGGLVSAGDTPLAWGSRCCFPGAPSRRRLSVRRPAQLRANDGRWPKVDGVRRSRPLPSCTTVRRRAGWLAPRYRVRLSQDPSHPRFPAFPAVFHDPHRSAPSRPAVERALSCRRGLSSPYWTLGTGRPSR